jgi:hypothetical protein
MYATSPAIYAVSGRTESAFGANPAALEQGIRSLSVMTAVSSL